MSNVKLRTNMIIAGNFIKFGTLLDEAKIPLHLRKRKYILRPGEPDIDAINFQAQTEAVERDVEHYEEEGTEEENIRVRTANKRASRR